MKANALITGLTVLSLGLTTGCVEQQNVSDRPAARGIQSASADDLLVVDCLLPGQVRQLGSRMTYVSARRPVQTTVQDCQIRGGEYVAYDRAGYATALQFWLPLAEQGDADAQNKLGEIYERGLAGPPDYERAMYWYKQAAEQGLKRAQINLGFLHEKGLGVERDLAEALQWYRKSSDLPDAVLIDRGEYEAQQRQLADLQRDLEQSREQLEKARRELRQRERRLERTDQSTGPAGRTDPSGGPEGADRQARDQRLTLIEQRERIARLESDVRRKQQRLLLLETEGQTLRQQLELVRNQLERTRQDSAYHEKLAHESRQRLTEARRQLATLRSQSSEQDREAVDRVQALQQSLVSKEEQLAAQRATVAHLESVKAQLQDKLAADKEHKALTGTTQSQLRETEQQLARARRIAAEREQALSKTQEALARSQAKLSAADRRLASLEAELQEREKRLAEHREQIERLRLESAQWQKKIGQLEQKAVTEVGTTSRTALAKVPSSGPSIQLIEPPLVAVRGADETRVPIKRGMKTRSIIGQVDAPGGLYALTVNGAKTGTNDSGLFESDIPVTGDVTPVSISAVDKAGRRASLGFSLVAAEQPGKMIAQRTNPLNDVDIGAYYALVIGNQEYDHLPDLDTSANDARSVASVLDERFGFEVKLLLDATRYEVLSALNELRKKLTEKDNLLVYYAGHGELDRVNLRGHWLPVDAEMHSTANWISNVAITDILNAMAARHVLLVADSCYSGALTRSSLSNLEAGQSDEARAHWLKTMVKMRSRTVMTSGGLAPVLDGGGGNHSVFAKAFLQVLRNIDAIAEGQRVYREVSARVAYEANQYQVEQVPEYAPIKYAGHESGDFLFIPKT